MSVPRRRNSFLSNPWLVSLTSLLLIAGLTVALWEPWAGPGIAGEKTLRLYCAAGMSKAVQEILHEYQTFKVSFNADYKGSGELLSNMRAVGGQGDLYLAADSVNMKDAQKLGLVAESIPVAIQHPVLIVSKDTQQILQKNGKPVTQISDLLRADIKVVLADEARTSVGMVTRRALESSGLWAKIETRRKSREGQVSTAATVNQVAVTVRLGGYVGIVWDAEAAQFPELEAIEVPEFKGVTEHVMIGVLTKSQQPTAALQFARYLTARDKGLLVFAKHHVQPVADADVWAKRPEIHLSAGAMLEPGLREVVKAFEEREGVTVDTSYAGCGILVSQMQSIKRGERKARFPDAYVSCDLSFTRKVEQWFESATIILRNDLVLIVPKDNPKGVQSLEDLKRPDLRIGLPHPKNSAMGAIIHDLLKDKLGFPESVFNAEKNERLVHTDAAHVLVNQMRAGALDVAVVGRSNAMSTPSNVREHLQVIDIDVPGALARQTFSIAKDTKHKYLLERLFKALVAPASLERFQQIGFKVEPR